jgi:hypothetical protein
VGADGARMIDAIRTAVGLEVDRMPWVRDPRSLPTTGIMSERPIVLESRPEPMMVTTTSGAASGRRSSDSLVTVSTQPSADRQSQQAERSHEQKGHAANPRIEQTRRQCQQRDYQPNA